ncbi:MAG: hypothetical protein HYS86_01815 [Candidatus Chisholmbacteria bacterium]|nr:hypothetical protein [Candidatus Chisholmbacteria bacterium]
MTWSKNPFLKLTLGAGLVGVVLFVRMTLTKEPVEAKFETKWWEFQSIDTMKYSRDPAWEKLNDPTFDAVIDRQVKQIAETGATHVAIATPYDEQFLPMLKRWVAVARKYGLKVWFRGNFSGWERWFGYGPISREEHVAQTKSFIEAHGSLFENGDVFSACPECENGGPGDPRLNGDVEGHRQFLIEEYGVMRDAFRRIDRDVRVNFNSMNGDVARLVMDEETTKALGGVVVIDHFVRTAEKMEADILALAESSGGKIVLGEFGAPIPDIHGNLSQEEQALWLEEVLKRVARMPEVVGVSYWTGVGGSTELWDVNGTARLGAATLTSFYSPNVASGVVQNELGRPIAEALVSTADRGASTSEQGWFYLPYLSGTETVTVKAEGYVPQTLTMIEVLTTSTIRLEKETLDLRFRLRQLFADIFPF